MKKQKSFFKRFVFISFFIGLLTGAAVFLYVSPYIYDFFREENPPEQIFSIEKPQEEVKSNLNKSEKTAPASINRERDTLFSTMLEKNRLLLDETDQLLANLEEFLTDSSQSTLLEIIESNSYFPEEKGGQIAKDRLASIQKYKIPSLEKNKLNIDSLLLGGHVETKKDILSVEFWYSPMNYSGYRFQSGRLILFGIPNIDKVNFSYKNQKLFLVYGSDTIQIIENENFTHIQYDKESGH